VPYSVLIRDLSDVEPSSCCEASLRSGCVNKAVEACVCEAVPTCCRWPFSSLCVELAWECGATCSFPNADSNCCSESPTPGCTVPEVASCVCAVEPGCCNEAFDQRCVNLAASLCNAQCPTVPATSRR
jgi:hypothetical protein